MKLTKLFLVVGSMSALAVFSVGPASATTATATFPVTAKVTAHCVISATGVVFDDYNPLATGATQATTPGQVKIQCSKGSPVKIALDHGTGNPSGGAYNLMKSPTKTSSSLRYQLFQPTNGSSSGAQWNDSNVTGAGTGTILTYTSIGKAEATFAIPGAIPAGEDADVAADYADAVTATIDF